MERVLADIYISVARGWKMSSIVFSELSPAANNVYH